MHSTGPYNNCLSIKWIIRLHLIILHLWRSPHTEHKAAYFLGFAPWTIRSWQGTANRESWSYFKFLSSYKNFFFSRHRQAKPFLVDVFVCHGVLLSYCHSSFFSVSHTRELCACAGHPDIFTCGMPNLDSHSPAKYIVKIWLRDCWSISHTQSEVTAVWPST